MLCSREQTWLRGCTGSKQLQAVTACYTQKITTKLVCDCLVCSAREFASHCVIGCGCCREKLEAWLAKHGKTPSRYRHMMCFGAHGMSNGGPHGHGSSGRRNAGDEMHSAGRNESCVTNSARQRLKSDVSRTSLKDDVACSLFTVAMCSSIS